MNDDLTPDAYRQRASANKAAAASSNAANKQALIAAIDAAVPRALEAISARGPVDNAVAFTDRVGWQLYYFEGTPVGRRESYVGAYSVYLYNDGNVDGLQGMKDHVAAGQWDKIPESRWLDEKYLQPLQELISGDRRRPDDPNQAVFVDKGLSPFGKELQRLANPDPEPAPPAPPKQSNFWWVVALIVVVVVALIIQANS